VDVYGCPQLFLATMRGQELGLDATVGRGASWGGTIRVTGLEDGG
jgi:hypothetical protein